MTFILQLCWIYWWVLIVFFFADVFRIFYMFIMNLQVMIVCVCVCVCVCVFVLSCVWLFANPWTEACQVPLSMGFSRQENWSGLPFPSPGQVVIRSVMSNSLWHHESQHARPPCPSPTPGVHPNSCPLSWWYHPAISSSVIPSSSCPQSLPASESLLMSQLFAWVGQSTGVSALASFPPKNPRTYLL